MTDESRPEAIELAVARHAAKSGVAIGVLLGLLGVLAVMAPLLTGIAVTVLIGALMFIGGVMQTVFAFGAESFGKGALKFLFGGLSIIAGSIIAMTPEASLGLLTMMLAAFFVASGGTDIVLGLGRESGENRGSMLFSGILSVLLGVLIIAGWPISGLFAIGVYVGLRMLVHGWELMALGRSGHEALTRLQDERIDMLEKHVRSGALMLQGAQQALATHSAMLLVLDSEVRQRISASEVDPAMRELNVALGEARERMKEAKAATGQAWDEVQSASYETFQGLQATVTNVAEKLDLSLGIDKGEESGAS